MSRLRLIAWLLALAVVAPVYRPALALDPTLDVSQYNHTSWKSRHGFTEGARISTLAQAPDGYLWFGTDRGLFRFDGVSAVRWQLASGEALPSPWIVSLLASRDGTLWIGTLEGLASWRDGRLAIHPE